MPIRPQSSAGRCYLRLLANWGLSLAGLPWCIDAEPESSPASPPLHPPRRSPPSRTTTLQHRG